MDGLVCDACGATLLLESDVRYVLKIAGHAAYDVLEITRADLEKDLEGEWNRLIKSLEAVTPESAQDQVHREFTYDLCPDCWRRYLKDPLAGLRSPQGE